MPDEIIASSLVVQFGKLEIAEPKVNTEFHSFGKLPVELQDQIWEFALPSEIINSDEKPQGNDRTQISGIPTIASVCKGSRDIVLRYGVWLSTPRSSKPMFFTPDSSVLHCGQGVELTVTANQVMHGLGSILMRMAVHLNGLNLLEDMIILASDGEAGRTPRTWHRAFDGRVSARVETCDPNARQLTGVRRCNEELYYPRTEWTSERWEEIVTAVKRAWLLAAWHVKDPVNVRQQDILNSSNWLSGRGNWIPRELHLMPKLVAGYMQPSS